MPTISVIVPVYNVEKYLRQCVDSILAQKYTDYELILVDYGSPDNCGVICDEYAAKYQFIHVIHRTNGGLSAARNSGIEWIRRNSNAQYVTFIDSDDWVSPEYLSQLFAAIKYYDADISVSGFCSFEDGQDCSFDTDGIYSIDCIGGREACVHYYQMKWTIPIAACAKLYKVDLFANIRFPEGKVYEDQGTVPKLWYSAEKVAIIRNASFYAYRIVESSISHAKFSSRKFEDVWNVQSCQQFFSEKDDAEIEALCSSFCDVLQAKYIVFAHHYNAKEKIPSNYQMSIFKALRLLRRKVKDHTYTWYLSQVCPKLVKLHSYIRKLEEISGIAKTER